MKHVYAGQGVLRESVLQQLNAYALVATAAGVGMLALAQPAEGKVVYTAAHKVIGRNNKVVIDLNHDGVGDFNLQETFLTTSSVGEDHSLILSVLPKHMPNRIWGKNHFASALDAGVKIGPHGKFSYGKKGMATDLYADGTGGSGTCQGPWMNAKNRYMGFKFSIKGATHFGWARLNVTCVTTFENHEVNGVLTGYAYETVADKPIMTGQKEDMVGAQLDRSSGLGHLAKGRVTMPRGGSR
jgi:hypothetical protein